MAVVMKNMATGEMTNSEFPNDERKPPPPAYAQIPSSASQDIRRSGIRNSSWIPDHFAAEGEYPRICLGGLGFGDLAVPDIHLGKGGPCQQVVRAQRGCLQTAADRFLDLAEFQKAHAKGMPAIEEVRVEGDAAA